MGAAWYLHLPYHLVRPEESLDESNVLDCWGATTATPSRITMERELPWRRWWTVNHSRDLRIRIEILTDNHPNQAFRIAFCTTSHNRLWHLHPALPVNLFPQCQYRESCTINDEDCLARISTEHFTSKMWENLHHCSPASDLANPYVSGGWCITCWDPKKSFGDEGLNPGVMLTPD